MPEEIGLWPQNSQRTAWENKGSTASALLEGKNNLLRMRQEIPLTDAEAAAVDDGASALESLLKRLANVPTPAGPTPFQLSDGTTTASGAGD
jgi:hypothetical protein